MKKLLTLVALAVLAVYLMPLATVGFNTYAEPPDDIYLPSAAIQSGASGEQKEHTTAPEAPTEPETLSGYDRKTRVTVNIAGETREMSLYEYLIGVVAAEMPASFPEEALKAQALAARTYTLYKVMLYSDGAEIPQSHAGAQLCDDHSHCKAFRDALNAPEALWGEQGEKYLDIIKNAVEQTDGLIAVFDGKPIAAVFHAASDGLTEAAVDVWGSSVPYLQSVQTAGGEQSPKYHSTVTVKQKDFIEAFKAHFPNAEFPDDATQWFKASNRSSAGGVIDVAVAGIRVSGAFIRQIAGLNSTNFRLKAEGDELIFTSQGYGHGVGMSQYGARQMALDGADFSEIITHYFTGTEILLKK